MKNKETKIPLKSQILKNREESHQLKRKKKKTYVRFTDKDYHLRRPHPSY